MMVSPISKGTLRVFPLLVSLALLFCQQAPAATRQEHLVYFQDTPYELNVYKIYGRKDGPTMMIIGGIQGNEPGGFLSADLYIDMALKRGNLIIVPRANFYSILLFRRSLNGDMNRMFGRKLRSGYDSKIVRTLESLMSKSDILLNLHDGWGYYRPKYINEMANPMRYGQSIIADCARYVCSRTGRTLELEKLAQQVVARVNDQIEDPKYHFHFMNTRTADPDSPYSEQRTSATFYALTRHAIPAFGVETSKNLPTIEMKVHQHNLAINAFMEIFGLKPEQPRIYLVPPRLKYLVVSVNNQIPVAVAPGQTLFVNPGDTVEVIHVEANYDRGLSVDILGLGTINDFRQMFTIRKPTFIVAQKDHIKFGRIPLALRSPGSPAPVQTAQVSGRFRVQSFIIEVEGKREIVPNGGRLEAVDGDRIRVVDINTDGPPPPTGTAVNFKGFVANKARNTGEDRGYLIKTATDLLERYSLSRTERIYEIVVEQGRRVLGRMTVRLNKPRLNFVILSHNGGPRLRLNNGESYRIRPGDHVRVLDIETNVPANRGVKVDVRGHVVKDNDAEGLLSFKINQTQPITLIVTREGRTLGQIVLKTG